MSDAAKAELAATGTLRAGINMGNALLVSGSSADGVPEGVAPDLARAIADSLGVDVTLVPFPSPGSVADGVDQDVWDIGLIAADPAREETISFTAAYVEVEATYLVPENSKFQSVADVDSEGTRIAISSRSAYDLFLSRTLQHATREGTEGVAGAFDKFAAEDLDAMAGLRPALVKLAEEHPDLRVIGDHYTAIQQAVGTQRRNAAAIAYLTSFIEEAKANGLIAELIERHKRTGLLSIAPPA